MGAVASIDVGIKGACVILHGKELLEVYDMPTVKLHSKTIVDWPRLANHIRLWKVDAVVTEQVGASPMMGTASSFNFGHSFGGILGVAAGMGIPCHTISPVKWKTFHGLLKKPKDAARLKIIDMYPGQKELFKLKKHVDRSDAVLLGLAWMEIN